MEFFDCLPIQEGQKYSRTGRSFAHFSEGKAIISHRAKQAIEFGKNYENYYKNFLSMDEGTKNWLTIFFFLCLIYNMWHLKLKVFQNTFGA